MGIGFVQITAILQPDLKRRQKICNHIFCDPKSFAIRFFVIFLRPNSFAIGIFATPTALQSGSYGFLFGSYFGPSGSYSDPIWILWDSFRILFGSYGTLFGPYLDPICIQHKQNTMKGCPPTHTPKK